MRPVLTLLTSHLGTPGGEDVLDAAVVMEITHLATLYHDDVMDQASTRRGVDTAHIVWGNNIAILTGELVFARASNLVSGLGQEALQLQAKIFEQLVLGQLHETIGPIDQEDPVDHYIQVLRDKTGSLIALAAQLGAMLSGADSSFQKPLEEFGQSIGVAFQLIDDIIDIESTESQSGKVSGTDLLAGVPTLPVLLLAKHDDSDSVKLLADISSGLDAASLPEVLVRLRKHPVMEEDIDFKGKFGLDLTDQRVLDLKKIFAIADYSGRMSIGRKQFVLSRLLNGILHRLCVFIGEVKQLLRKPCHAEQEHHEYIIHLNPVRASDVAVPLVIL
jgi:heptaprenyl diphosphate synthase